MRLESMGINFYKLIMNLKNFRLKNIIFTGLLVFLFVEVLIVFPSRLEQPTEPEEQRITRSGEELSSSDGFPDQAESKVQSQQKMQGLHLVESQQGRRDWELFAVSAEGNQGKGSWNLKKVRVLFYNSEKVDYVVTGDEGAIDSRTKDLYIRGNVVTKSANGYTFETPSISYNSGVRLIESPEQVVMKGPGDEDGNGLVLKGHRMEVMVDQTRMIIRENVIAEKKLKEDKKFRIRAERAEFSGKNREARFLGKVSINYDKMKIEGPEASFLYKNAANVISSIQVKGGVKVSDADKFASSENLDLDLLANKFTFRGKPRVIQNDDELTGDEIIFLDGGKRVKVEKVRARVEK